MARPKREIGTDYPPGEDRVSLSRSADLLVHLHAITPSTPLGRTAPGGTARAPEDCADPVTAIRQAAHPLRSVEPDGPLGDLRPLKGIVGDARLVGIGQAAHGSRDFLALQHRMFRYLVEEEGFRLFVLEAPWSAGLRLDDHVRTGRGDPARIMAEEFHNAYLFMRTPEVLELVRWMRAYNVRHRTIRCGSRGTTAAGPVPACTTA